MSTQFGEIKREMGQLVERAVRLSELARERGTLRKAGRPEVCEFLCVSQAIGSAGMDVARLLSERLGWPLLDREILHEMARDSAVREKLYEHMDERDVGWLEGAMHFVLRTNFKRDDYFHRLTEAVLALARKSPAIFVGRGCDLILPREHGLRVLLAGEMEHRVSRYATEHNVSEAAARTAILDVEHERSEFIRHHFGKQPPPEARFDLAVNLDRVSVEHAADLILLAAQQRGVVARDG